MNSQSTANQGADKSAPSTSPKRSTWGFLKTGFALTCFAAFGAGIGYIYMEVVDLSSNVVTKTDGLQNDIDRQKQRSESIDKGILNLQAAVRDSKSANQTIVESMGNLSNQISTLSTDLTNNIAAVINKQKTLSTDVASLTKTSSHQAGLIKNTQSQLANARKDLEDVSRDIGNQIASLTDDIAGNGGQIESLGNSFARANEALDAANRVIVTIETRYSTLQDEVAFMQNGFADQQSQIAELASGFATVRDELARAHATNTETIAAVSEVSEAISDLPENAIAAVFTDQVDPSAAVAETLTGDFIIAETAAGFEPEPETTASEVDSETIAAEETLETPQLDPILANGGE